MIFVLGMGGGRLCLGLRHTFATGCMFLLAVLLLADVCAHNRHGRSLAGSRRMRRLEMAERGPEASRVGVPLTISYPPKLRSTNTKGGKLFRFFLSRLLPARDICLKRSRDSERGTKNNPQCTHIWSGNLDDALDLCSAFLPMKPAI